MKLLNMAWQIVNVGLLLICFLTSLILSTNEKGRCDGVELTNTRGHPCVNYCDCFPKSNKKWYNAIFWGGYTVIATQRRSIDLCSKVYKNTEFFVVSSLPETQTDTISKQDVCLRNQNEVCKETMYLEMSNSSGKISFRFPWINTGLHSGQGIYACLDHIFTDTCDNLALNFASTMVNENISEAIIHEYGWYNSFMEGDQYRFPTVQETEMVFDACTGADTQFLLEDDLPDDIDEFPRKFILCRVNHHEKTGSYVKSCHFAIHFRKCNGRLQFETSWLRYLTVRSKVCLVVSNSVKIVPELRFNSHYINNDNNNKTMHVPQLQFRCSFEMVKSALYKINWYINNTLQNNTRSVQAFNDLVFKTDRALGFNIKCGVRNTSWTNSTEMFSSNYFAGWKISESTIELVKGGSSTVTVDQTIPIGCTYTEEERPDCREELSFLNLLPGLDVCSGGIQINNAEEPSKSFYEIVKLKVGERWTGIRQYSFTLSTIDVSYDDKTLFDLEAHVTDTQYNSSEERVVEDIKVIGKLRIYVLEAKRHRNKVCYSHVDPHLRTSDGRYFDQQKEGDFMLAQNLADQLEIQESARFCDPSMRSPPICACGVAIRFGADVFMINRCGSIHFLDFIQCKDGGLLDVRRIHDFHYTVRTPTGTLIDVSLHSWGNTMNIDIYMSARDFGHIDGLCGHFDGDGSNDFKKRDGTAVDGNMNHTFSDSWRLSDNENLFKNFRRELEPWNGRKGRQLCFGVDSMTNKKCKTLKRNRRDSHLMSTDLKRLYQLMSQQKMVKSKRSTSQTVPLEEARLLCNNSITESAAVKIVPDKLADENVTEVLSQCIYDVTTGGDTVWAEAHVQALNSMAAKVIELSPDFASSNSEMVTTFLKQTCPNNCRDHGNCSDTGDCFCTWPYGGPDCGIDLRIPPTIFDIQGGGVCDTGVGKECVCFTLRADNIFDGFMCDIKTYKVYFNSTWSQIRTIQIPGDYEDIFTGVCCISDGRRKWRSTNSPEPTPSVLMHDIAISNNGQNYGESSSVYVFDTTCIQRAVINREIMVNLKETYCYIGNSCVKQGTTSSRADECYKCVPYSNSFKWTKEDCENSSTSMTSGTMISVVIGTFLCVMVVSGCIVSFVFKKGFKKHRQVHDARSSCNVSQEYIHGPESYNEHSKVSKDFGHFWDLDVKVSYNRRTS